MKWILAIYVFLHATMLVPSSIAAQVVAEDFFATGQTTRTGENCYQLTYDDYWSSGGIWHQEPIDLSESFEMELKLMMGCKDAGGADGMVFVFTPFRGGGGYQGEGMGFAGLQPSLGIEVDTWENEHLGDPPQDHVAILRDGYVMHYYNLEGPVPIPNVEDCKLHLFEISWNAEAQKLTLRLDEAEIISYTGDIVTEIFYDNPEVYWGVTAATGKFTNRHEICFERLEFAGLIRKSLFTRVLQSKLLHGEPLTLDKITFSEKEAGLSRTTREELYKLVNLLKRNPDLRVTIDAHSFQQATTDANGQRSREQVAQLAAFLIKHGIEEKRVLARGMGDRFPVKEGEGSNDRVEVHLYQART